MPFEIVFVDIRTLELFGFSLVFVGVTEFSQLDVVFPQSGWGFLRGFTGCYRVFFCFFYWRLERPLAVPCFTVFVVSSRALSSRLWADRPFGNPPEKKTVVTRRCLRWIVPFEIDIGPDRLAAPDDDYQDTTRQPAPRTSLTLSLRLIFATPSNDFLVFFIFFLCVRPTSKAKPTWCQKKGGSHPPPQKKKSIREQYPRFHVNH